MILNTTGTLTVRLAAESPIFDLGDGITAVVTAHRNPTSALPDGRSTIVVTSPEGYLHWDEDGDVQVLRMGDAPVPEGQLTPEIVGMFGGSNG